MASCMAAMTVGRGVEGVEGGALGAVVFLGREQRFQLVAEGLPAGVLVAAGDRVGEDRQGDRPRSRRSGRASAAPPAVAGPLLLLDGLQGADGGEDVAGLGLLAAGDARGRRGVGSVADRLGVCQAAVGVTGGGGVSVAGWRFGLRRASVEKSCCWPRDALTLSANDCG